MNTLELKSQTELRRMKDDTSLTREERQAVIEELNRRFAHCTCPRLKTVTPSDAWHENTVWIRSVSAKLTETL